MKLEHVILVLILLAVAVVGCGGGASGATPEAVSADLAASGDGGTYTSAVLNTAYEGALPASSQLVLGTFALEGTEHAITPEQAKALLPLWRAIQGGSLQSDAETNTVLKQIEATMTTEQLAAITAMQLTIEDLGRWMQEQGVNLAPPSGAAGGSGSLAPPNGMSEEEMAAMRATGEAGGGFPPGGGGAPGGGGPSGDMSDEERASMRATAEASGMTRPGDSAPGGGFGGQLTILAEQVIDLLAERAVE
jgi:hypothetical protein